jgi:hypothetical protein
MRINLSRKPKYIFSSLLILVIVSLSIYPSTFSDSNYSFAIRSGSQVFEVKNYDEDLWKSTINPLSNPSNLFGGEANISGAKSKLVSLRMGGNYVLTSSIFAYFFFRWFNVPYNSLLAPNGYDFEYINGRYPYYHFIWNCEFGYWEFTTKSFKNYADYIQIKPDPIPPEKHNIILQHPSNFSRILLDYNDFAAIVNNDSTIQAANYSLPLLNGEEFLWQLIIDGLIIANPFNSYLNQIIDVLDCSNASVQDNSLIFRKSGEEIYIVEISFNNFGMIDTLLMKNTENKEFYHITSYYPQYVVYVILGVISGLVLGLIGLSVFLKQRQQKEIIKNFK